MAVLADIFGVLATITGIVMFLSPIPTIREIYRTESVAHMPFVPLAAMVSNAHIWMVYGWLVADYVALFGCSAFGVAVSLVYVVIYYRYTAEKAYARNVLGVFALVITTTSLYAVLGANGYTGQSYDAVSSIIGYICVTSSVVMYTSPFEKIRLVFLHRSAVFVPIEIVTVGAINSAVWVVYSLLDVDWTVFAPNTFVLVLGLLQIALYWVFHPSKHPLPVDGTDDLEMAATKDDKQRSVSFVLSPTSRGEGGDKPRADSAPYVAVRSPLAPLHEV